MAEPSRGRAHLQLRFAPDTRGRTYLARQFVAYPFHICRALYHDAALPGLATLYIQSCSGGLFEDDRLEFEIDVAEGASAHVTTQAATVVHSMPDGVAVQVARIRAASGSYLEYLPDPQILFPHARLESKVQITLSDDAVVLASDCVLMHDPVGSNGVFTSCLSEIEISDDAGKRLSIDRTLLHGPTVQARYPGISGSFKAQGTVIVATKAPPSGAIVDELEQSIGNIPDIAWGMSHLPKSSGLVVRILTSDGATLRHAVRELCSALRFALKGSRALHERK